MILYVARHGETNWNVEGRYQGQRESQLTATGRLQAERLADALAAHRIARVVSSPLARCVDTARPLAQRLGLAAETDARLLEIAHGTWEGRLRGEIERDDPQTMRSWRDAPDEVRFVGGESLADVLGRWQAFVAQLDGKNDVAVVTHDVLVRLALLVATNRELGRLWEPRVVNGGYAVLDYDEGRWAVVEACVDAHLGDARIEPTNQAL